MNSRFELRKTGMIVKKRWLIPALIATLLLAVCVVRAYASVTLVSFTATAQVGFILIEWETATELDNSGFYVQRSTQSATGYVRITALIPSISDGVTGAQYQYPDNGVETGVTYYYKLETISRTTGDSEFYGPIHQSLGGSNTTQTSTPTLTATITGTSQGTGNTQTPTPTGTSGAATSTATLASTSTPTSILTPTPIRTSTSAAQNTTTTPQTSLTATLPGPATTLEGTVFPSPTSTLLPLPSITLIFPVLTPTQTPTPSPTSTPGPTPTPTDTPEPPAEPIPTRWKIVVILLIVLWVFLAGFLTFFIRRMSPS